MARFAAEWAQTRETRPKAAWVRQGVGRGTLRGHGYERTSRGHYRSTLPAQSCQPTTSTQRIVDAAAVIPPGALITGWAAAYVHGVDALDGLDDYTLAPLPVPVLLPPGLHRRSTDGIHYRQCKRPVQGELLHEVPVTMCLRTALDLACTAPALTEAVVRLDAFLSARMLTLPRLQRGTERLTGRRGARQARRAVELALPGVRSTWESRLRMFGVIELGLVDLQPNRAVFDKAGNLLGIPDLLDAEAGLAIEYDGATWRSDRSRGHRDIDQHREDNAREERLERAGLVVVRAEKADLTRFRSLLGQRIRSARRDGLQRDRTRDRWTLQEPDGWFGLPA